MTMLAIKLCLEQQAKLKEATRKGQLGARSMTGVRANRRWTSNCRCMMSCLEMLVTRRAFDENMKATQTTIRPTKASFSKDHSLKSMTRVWPSHKTQVLDPS